MNQQTKLCSWPETCPHTDKFMNSKEMRNQCTALIIKADGRNYSLFHFVFFVRITVPNVVRNLLTCQVISSIIVEDN